MFYWYSAIRVAIVVFRSVFCLIYVVLRLVDFCCKILPSNIFCSSICFCTSNICSWCQQFVWYQFCFSRQFRQIGVANKMTSTFLSTSNVFFKQTCLYVLSLVRERRFKQFSVKKPYVFRHVFPTMFRDCWLTFGPFVCRQIFLFRQKIIDFQSLDRLYLLTGMDSLDAPFNTSPFWSPEIPQKRALISKGNGWLKLWTVDP